jgi:hypothetical protein
MRYTGLCWAIGRKVGVTHSVHIHNLLGLWDCWDCWVPGLWPSTDNPKRSVFLTRFEPGISRIQVRRELFHHKFFLYNRFEGLWRYMIPAFCWSAWGRGSSVRWPVSRPTLEPDTSRIQLRDVTNGVLFIYCTNSYVYMCSYEGRISC